MDNALRCVDDLRPGKPRLVHGLPQVRGRLHTLVDLVPLHGTLIASVHGELQRQVRVRDQGLRRLLVIAVQLRVVELESVHVSAAHAVRCPAVNVLLRVNLVHLSAGIHADVAAFRKGAKLLIGQFGLLHPLLPSQNVHKDIVSCSLFLAHKRLCICLYGGLCGAFLNGGIHARVSLCPLSCGLHGAIMSGSCILNGCVLSDTVSGLLNTASDSAQCAAHKAVIQRVRPVVRVLVMRYGFRVIGCPLKDRLHQVLHDLLSALGQDGDSRFSCGTSAHFLYGLRHGVIQNTAAKGFLERTCHIGDLLRCCGQSRAACAIGHLLPIACSGLPRLLCAGAEGTCRHRRQSGTACQQSKPDVSRHLRTGHAHIHRELTCFPGSLLGSGNVLLRGFRQGIRRVVDILGGSIANRLVVFRHITVCFQTVLGGIDAEPGGFLSLCVTCRNGVLQVLIIFRQILTVLGCLLGVLLGLQIGADLVQALYNNAAEARKLGGAALSSTSDSLSDTLCNGRLRRFLCGSCGSHTLRGIGFHFLVLLIIFCLGIALDLVPINAH